MTAERTDRELPPVPSPRVIRRVYPGDYRYGDVYGYTRKQMIEYARKAVRAAAAMAEGGEHE
jgi:hypothetical protein